MPNRAIPTRAMPTRAMPTRVMLVEDHELLAASVAATLESEGYDVVRPPCLDDAAVLDCAREAAPHTVLLDLHLVDGRTSVSLISPLRDLGAAVLVVTAERDRSLFAECVEAGAAGVLHKSAPLNEFLRTVGHVSAGGVTLSEGERQDLLRHLRERRAVDGAHAAVLGTLSAREQAVLDGLTEGLSASCIAERDCVSLATIRSQIRSVLTAYESAGGSVRSETFAGSGHAPFLDAGAGRFAEVFYDFLDRAEDAGTSEGETGALKRRHRPAGRGARLATPGARVQSARVLTLDEALDLLSRARTAAEEIGVPMSFAVMDPGGHLLALTRMDGAPWISADVAQGKAWTSAAYGVPSAAQKEKMGPMPTFATALTAMTHGRYTPQTGAVPVFRDGTLLGALGGSGGTGEQDEAACAAAVEQVGLSTTR